MTTGSSQDGFQRADQEKRRLTEILADVGGIADGLKAAGAHQIHQLKARVTQQTFKVMVVGEFKRGKSTLVNALLGAKVLPAHSWPVTAVLTEVTWGEVPAVVLHPIGGGAPVTLTDVKLLEEQITIPRGVEDAAEHRSPWRLAEISWPLELLRDGVVVIDTPGLNEDDGRDELTTGSLHEADAIVFVQDAQHAPSTVEKNFIRNHLYQYDVFFVINKADIIDNEERERTLSESILRIRKVRDQDRRDRFHVTDARGALTARLNGDDAAWRTSAVATFAADLTGYLTTDRHRAKILGPARELAHEIVSLRGNLESQLGLTHQEIGVLRERQQQAQAPLRRLEQRAQQIRRELDQQRQHLQTQVRASSHERLLRIALDAPTIIADLTPEAKLSVNPWKSEKAAKAYAEELGGLASVEIGERFRAGHQQYFTDLMEPALKRLSDRAGQLVNEFMADFARLRQELTGDDLAVMDSDQRDLARPDIDSLDLLGSIQVGQIWGQIVGSYAVILAWAFTPWGLTSLIGGILTANAAILYKGKQLIARKVRREVSEEVAAQIRAKADGIADEQAAKFGARLTAVIDALTTRIDVEIQQLRAQVDDAVRTLEQGEEAVRRRQDQLARWESGLDKNGAALEDLIADVERA